MIYLVIEEYGFSYESGWTNYVGYCKTKEEAGTVVSELLEQKVKYDKLKELLDNEYDSLYEVYKDEDEFYDRLKEFEDTLGMPEDRGYDYDYYNIYIKEIAECEN